MTDLNNFGDGALSPDQEKAFMGYLLPHQGLTVEGLRHLLEDGLGVDPEDTIVPDDPEEYFAIPVENGDWVARYFYGLPYYIIVGHDEI